MIMKKKDVQLTETVERVLSFTWERIGHLNEKALGKMAQQESPWKDARKELCAWERSNNKIECDSIRIYFKKVITQETKINIKTYGSIANPIKEIYMVER